MKMLNNLTARRMILAMLSVVLLVGVTSCKDEMDYYEKPYVTLSPTFSDNTIPFKQEGGTQKITIETNRRFAITFSEGAEWVSATPMEATEGSHQIVITALPNRSEDAREAQMIIKTSTTQHVFLIMQLGASGMGITYTSLAEIAKLGQDAGQDGKTMDQDLRIRATVTTHHESRQFPFAGFHYIQDAEGNALVLTVPKGEDPLNFGDLVTAKLKGCKISNYNGTVQLQVSHEKMTIVSGKPIEPIETTLADIVAGKHPNQYVRVKGVQFVQHGVPFFDPANTYSSTRREIIDKEGKKTSVEIWKTSIFRDELIPEESGSITAVVTINKTFFNLRPTLRTDIKLDQPRFEVGGGGSGNGDDPTPEPPTGNVYGVDLKQTARVLPLGDDFANGGEDYKDFTLTGWLNKAIVGTRAFQKRSFNKVHYAQASAFKSTDAENQSVLVTPRLKMTAGSSYTLDVTYSTSYTNGATLAIQQLDKDGKLVKTLEVINDNSAPSGNGNQHYKKSYTLTGTAEAGYIALLYEGKASESRTTTYQVEALTVK